MKFILGLGNPGRLYASTRHNVGFEVLEGLANKAGKSRWKKQFRAETIEMTQAGENVLLIKPLTYMNNSGQSLETVVRHFRVQPGEFTNVLIVLDDRALPLGKIRIRAGGSAGGHKGLASVMESAGTQQVARLRIGIGSTAEPKSLSDFVLSKFHANEKKALKQALHLAVEACECWISAGVESAMHTFNSKVKPLHK